MFELESEGQRVIQARLADRLDLSAPSVSAMVRRLRAGGYLQTGPDLTLELTDKGQAVASTIVRRHHLAERFLTDLLGLPWYRAHIEACRWEHVISPEVEELMVARLGNPATCPHGNPIPGTGAPVPHLVPLTDTEVGDDFRLERVSEELELDHDTLVYLDGHGFVPGVQGTVSAIAPDHTRLVNLDTTSLALGPSLASKLFVTLR